MNRAFLAQLLDGSGSAITHASPQPADELVDERSQGSLVGHAAFDAFGDQFVGGRRGRLPWR